MTFSATVETSAVVSSGGDASASAGLAFVEFSGLLAPLDVDLSAAHVFALKVLLGFLGVFLVIELREGVGAFVVDSAGAVLPEELLQLGRCH
jgi:hypothetical protein